MNFRALLVIVLLLVVGGCVERTEEHTTSSTAPQTTTSIEYPLVVKAKSPSNETLMLWSEFKKKYGKDWQIEWNKYAGSASEIYNGSYGFEVNGTSGETLGSVAKQFLLDNKWLWGMDDPTDLKEWEFNKSKYALVPGGLKRGERFVLYQKYYEEHLINATVMIIALENETGGYKLRRVISTYPKPNIPLTPKIDTYIALAIVNLSEETTNVGVELFVFPREYNDTIEYYLTYRISHWNYPITMTYHVDAITGDVLDKQRHYYSDIIPPGSKEHTL
ncbi:MAG: hypothetical protein L6243_00090 [Candidatus Altiarchaeales archaeon]|nr:hypothetical protein [Candidatus Altiarchaeota archaeon]MBU4342082.1 hypothetical protein [Candidatus Altiarchaeota archaeon]MBU4406173.1 hypothetical protein [Candidatus Altiarchaeota archaeon]MBU4436963.1 hypothetical protein [Candidatus Altiarchaeota archaeon]MCG2781969.1 hypothetical protein [Candidatus Altiarchaeales archaeon]